MSALALGAGIGIGIFANRWFTKNQEFKAQPASVADLLGWAYLVAPGVVMQKDGSFFAGWRFRGPDLSSATTEEVNLLSKHVNDAFLPFSDGWMFHIEAVRRPATQYAPEGHFNDPVTRLIDWERRKNYEAGGRKFETECFLVATFLPGPERYSRLGSFFMQGESSEVGWAEELGSFRRALANLEDRLSGRLSLGRLSSDELLTHLHQCLTGLDHPVMAPPHGAYLNILLADQPLVGGSKMQIAPDTPHEKHVRIVAIQGFPSESFSGMLDVISHQSCNYRWSSRIIPLGQQTAAKLIKKQQLAWFQKRNGAGNLAGSLSKKEKSAQQQEDERVFQDQNAIAMARATQAALAENNSGEVRFCHLNSQVVVMETSADEADRVAKEMVKVITDFGFTARIETINAFDAFLGTLPGDGFHNLRRPMLSSRNIADLLPVTSVWPGSAESPCPFYAPGSPALMWTDTAGSTPFRLNLHSSPPDVGHSIVIGGTGGGKSTFVGSVVAQFQRYPGAQVFVFDKGYSFWLLAAAAGGDHFDINPGPDGLKFQPLAKADDAAERVWAGEWFEILFELQGLSLSANQRNLLEHAIAMVGQMERRMRTLTALLMQLQDTAMREALTPYITGGQFGMLDGDADALVEGRFQTFEMHRIMDMGDKITVPLLLYIFHRLEQRLDGSPTLVVIEEAWQPLTNGLFASRIKEWLLTWRKRNAAVMLVTQSLSQIYDLPNRHVLVDSCPTRFLLPNPQAATPSSAPMYRDLGLNDKEIKVLAEARQKRDYYYRSPAGSRLFELRLGPVTLAFLSARQGMSLEETMKRAQALAEAHGPRWPGVWLEELGQTEAAQRFNDYLGGNDGEQNEIGDAGSRVVRRDHIHLGEIVVTS